MVVWKNIKRGRRVEHFGKKIKILKNGDAEEYQVVGKHLCIDNDTRHL